MRLTRATISAAVRAFMPAAVALLAGCSKRGDSRARSVLTQGSSLAAPDAPVDAAASPSTAQEIVIPAGDRPTDFAVWPSGPEAAVLLRDSTRKARVALWKAGETKMTSVAQLPNGFEARGIAVHPVRRTLFVSGEIDHKSQILAFAEERSGWRRSIVLETPNRVDRMILGPRPFSTSKGDRYRIFFEASLPGGAKSLRSVTEKGELEYQVAGPTSGVVTFAGLDEDSRPKGAIAPAAIPLAIHPRGEPLLWQDDRGCAHLFRYQGDNWGKETAVAAIPCGGSARIAANGAAYLFWRSGQPGVSVIRENAGSTDQQAVAYKFISAPASAPDGRGVIGIASRDGGRAALVYAPINVPLGDVANAWQFASVGACEEDLLTRNGGLLRSQGSSAQLYTLYDGANYGDGYGTPLLVTTDLFWENFATAFNGTFILLERRQAVPRFWAFVDAANAAIARTDPTSRWGKAFAALAAVRGPNPDGEAAHIVHDSVTAQSLVLDSAFNFAELMPRGHYTMSDEMRLYFRAVHYFTELGKVGERMDPTALASLPMVVQRKALDWIEVYRPFIAPPRARLVWADSVHTPPTLATYAQNPWKYPTVFPLGWGLDNESLEASKRIWEGRPQPARFPSGVDVATVYGSALGRSLLTPDFAMFPKLRPDLDSVAARHPARSDSATIYERWLDALAVEWADSASFPGAPAGSGLWSAKRLQTGLASWATVREATILVTERAGAAEGGEGGFEEMVRELPRGYVEPSPKTFEAIAGLYDALARRVGASRDLRPEGDTADSREKTLPPEGEVRPWSDMPLREGILHRLAESSAAARQFATMAEKELRGEALSDSEYEAIRSIGGTVEHEFKVYKSLANKDLAISTPDPLPKIADVAGDLRIGLLEAAVGGPLEWRQLVPYFGRREIAIGSVYSYYEFKSEKLYDNERWRKEVDSRPHPRWIQPFLARDAKACHAAALP